MSDVLRLPCLMLQALIVARCRAERAPGALISQESACDSALEPWPLARLRRLWPDDAVPSSGLFQGLSSGPPQILATWLKESSAGGVTRPNWEMSTWSF